VDKSKKKNIDKITVPLSFPILLWMIFLFVTYFQVDTSALALLPRNIKGSLGILTSPLIHANFSHLISNSIPLIILGWAIFYFYNRVSYLLFIFIYVVTGILVWILAREAYHVGASGLVYGFVSFLFFSGIFRKDNKSISIALVVTFLYGGMVWGIFPGAKNISWESHLLGAISGIIAAYIFRKVDPPTNKYDWEDEEDDFNVDELEVSYDPEKNKFNF
jgi:membrane associated rhomboid family serine protease